MQQRASSAFFLKCACVIGLMTLSTIACEDGSPAQPLSANLSVMPLFHSAAGVVPVSSVQVVIRRSDSTVAVDTTIFLEAPQDSVDIQLQVELSSNVETFFVELIVFDTEGAVVFRAGPITVTLSSGEPTPTPTPMTVEYVGVGHDAASVQITTDPTPVNAGASLELEAVAHDSEGEVIPGTPIVWSSTSQSVADFPDRAVGTLVASSVSGVTQVVASLLTGPADTVTVLVIGAVDETVAAAIAALEDELFLMIDQGVEDSLSTREDVVDWAVFDQVSFAASRDLFAQASSDNPLSQTAAFGLALTTLLLLEDDARLRAYVEAWEDWGQQYDALFEGTGPFPPTLSEGQDILRDVVKPAFTSALTTMSTIDSSTFTFTITPRMMGELPAEESPREIDLTDVHLIRAWLGTTIALINTAVAYSVDPSPYGTSGFDQAFAQSSAFLTLGTGGDALLAEARTQLFAAVDEAQQAFDLLVLETDDQSDDLLKYDANDIDGFADFDDPIGPADVQDVRDVLADVEGALGGPFTVTEDFGSGTVVDLVINASRIFLAPVQDLKALLPSYITASGAIRWTALAYDEFFFPDPTFNDVLPGITSTDSLAHVFDIESFWYDANQDIDRWVGLTQSPLDGDLFAITERGNLVEIAADFATVTDRPNATIAEIPWSLLLTLGANTGTGELLTGDWDGVLQSRPDDATSPWVFRTVGYGCCLVGIEANPGGDGSLLWLVDWGEHMELSPDLSQATVLPRLPYSASAFATNDVTTEAIALSYDGLVFARPPDRVTAWVQRYTLPFVDYYNEWVGISQSPIDGDMFVITEAGDLQELSSDLVTLTDRPDVPATDIVVLRRNTQTGELLALTGDGRLFSRPDDATSPWTLQLTLARVILGDIP